MSGPIPAALSPVTVPASWLYGGVIARRNRRYDRGVGVQRIDVPVVSVGNVTVGGVGKSPMVAWIVDRLRADGHRPVIAMRGYGAVDGEPSDEQAEYAMRCPDTDVVADPDRTKALRAYLPAHGDVDCVVLDDGFQHRRLHRDVDLVLIDASRRTFADRLLPAGTLREPLAGLSRATAVVMTRADTVDDMLVERVERTHGRAPIAWSRHGWTSLRVHEDAAPRNENVSWLGGRRVLTMLGVGHPRAIERQIEAAGAVIAAKVSAADHERYDLQKVMVARGLCDGIDAVVVTGKDWVKLRHLIDLSDWPAPIVVPELRLDVFDGEGALVELIRAAVR